MTKVTAETLKQMKALRKQGLTYEKIAKELSLSPSCISVYLKGIPAGGVRKQNGVRKVAAKKKTAKKKVARIAVNHTTTKTTNVVVDTKRKKPKAPKPVEPDVVEYGNDKSFVWVLFALCIGAIAYLAVTAQ